MFVVRRLPSTFIMKTRSLIISLLVCLAPAVAAAQDGVPVPDEVKPFIEKGMVAKEVESGDLNGDGTKDYILVLEKPFPEEKTYDEAGDAERPTLVLIRDAAGK